jgi:hypothetical protein
MNTKQAYDEILDAFDKTAIDIDDPNLDRHVGKIRRKLALGVVAPLKGLSRLSDGEIYTYQRGTLQKDFKINGFINEALKAAQETMDLLTDLNI